MDINDYLIDPRELDWHKLLDTWTWLVSGDFEVWLMNRFGDLFLIFDDGSIHMLDIGAGAIERLADSREEFFAKADQGGNGSDWFMIPLVTQLVASDMTLGEGECYSFKQPPILGGEYDVENSYVIPIEGHFHFYGSIHKQIKDLPDGAKVEIKMVDPREEGDV